MIDIIARDPTHLFFQLGHEFFNNSANPIDLSLGDRRHISFGNKLIVQEWPYEWTGKGLFSMVGYSDQGSKMNILRKTYVNEERLALLKRRLTTHKGYEILGVPFNMAMEKKGGCLSSFHLLRTKKGNTLFVHGKVAELPRKFVADLVLVGRLLHDIDDEWPTKVVFLYSTMYYSIVSLRAYVPILGYTFLEDSERFNELPIEEPRDYQVGTQESIAKVRKQLVKRYGNKILSEGMYKHIDYRKGELK